MHTQEWDDIVDCCDCGATVAPDTDRVFALSDETFLCFACAVARGGVYDGMEERWTVAPNAAGVPDERSAHA
jgi:hypothetical protein